jgi:hypothetical protein
MKLMDSLQILLHTCKSKGNGKYAQFGSDPEKVLSEVLRYEEEEDKGEYERIIKEELK